MIRGALENVPSVPGFSPKYYFTGGDGSIFEQQKELNAIMLGQAYATRQSVTDPDNIADIIQQIYNTLTPAAFNPNGSPKSAGGNYNFSYLGITVDGQPVNVSELGCSFSRCGMFDSLDYSHSGGFHVDTANPFFFPIGTVTHTFVDVLGGNTWWSGGIPRTP
jgi:hypothetical protein